MTRTKTIQFDFQMVTMKYPHNQNQPPIT